MSDSSTKSQEAVGSDLFIHGTEVNPSFSAEVKKACGENVMQCYQCGECTAGCPAAFAMEISPNRMMRMVQIGLEKPVLSSATIWLCAGCETCATRCPRGLSVAKVMDACREMAIAQGIKASESDVLTFHKQFLADVQRNGRVHEVGLLGRYKLLSGNWFNDIPLGVRMFTKGKLALMPTRIKGLGEVKKLYKKFRGRSKM